MIITRFVLETHILGLASIIIKKERLTTALFYYDKILFST